MAQYKILKLDGKKLIVTFEDFAKLDKGHDIKGIDPTTGGSVPIPYSSGWKKYYTTSQNENIMKKSELREIIKEEIQNFKESNGDYELNVSTEERATELYNKGFLFGKNGNWRKAEELRQQALRVADWLHWGDDELPPYDFDEEFA